MPLPPPPTVVVVRALLTDNGDGDGWADTNETVEMRLVLYNRTGQDLSGLVVRLSTSDPKVVCIPQAAIAVGSLADREARLTDEAFRFLVADVTRPGVDEDASVRFDIEMSSNQFAELPESAAVTVDLDLDVAGGTGRTSFYEGFEGGFGAFTTMHLDESLNPPESDLGNHDEGLINSDGYRCQYDNPAATGSQRPWCHLGAHGRPDAYYFHLTGDRAFSGLTSLHFGIFLSEALGFTTPNAALQAVRTDDPVDLGWGAVCSESRSLECALDDDCPIGESCVEVSPELAITHQISQLDHRWISTGFEYTQGAQRAILQVQLADQAGAPAGPWLKIEPRVNAYDTKDFGGFLNCTFDPIDDGNTEDDAFPGSLGLSGPSSTCAPQRTFVHQGDTEAFDPNAIGDASDGPGLEGETGVGTWVETRFDLRRFRGRRLRVRVLESTIETGAKATVEELFTLNPFDGDDGWFIDDVTITDTLTTPATVTVDTRDNLDIKQDYDLDNVGAACDCNSDDATAWDLPGGVQDLRLSHAGGAGGSTALSWTAPAYLGGTAVLYDTLRAADPADFLNTADCLESGNGSDTTAQDPATPAPGALQSFLVRARHSCGPGPTGVTSSGLPRPARACP